MLTNVSVDFYAAADTHRLLVGQKTLFILYI